MLLLLGGQLAEQVGGVVGLHRLEHVGGAVAVQGLQDRDLVVLGQLLEDVGEPLVVELGGQLEAALVGQVVEHVGDVGGLHLLERREQHRRALGLGAAGQAADLVDVEQQRLAAAAQPSLQARARRARADEHLRDRPVPLAVGLDGDVLDGRGAAAVAQRAPAARAPRR